MTGDLPELIPGRPDYRVMIATGVLVRGYSVVRQLAPDGAAPRDLHILNEALAARGQSMRP